MELLLNKSFDKTNSLLFMYRVFATEEFIKKLLKYLDKAEQKKFLIFREKIKVNPYLGDQLRFPFLREFKTKKGKRVYFLVYEEFRVIYFISVSNKKNQKDEINEIVENLGKYYEEIRKKFRAQ
jgi:hypothetical protein